MQDTRQRYMVAIVPPADFTENIQTFRRAFAASFPGVPVLHDEPYVNLFYPFYSSEEAIPEISAQIATMAKSKSRFIIETGAYGTFKSNRVVYLDIKSSQYLMTLDRYFRQKLKVKLVNEYRRKVDYHPHIQIARLNANPELFQKVAADVASIQQGVHLRFECSSIHLLQYGDKSWAPISLFEMGG